MIVALLAALLSQEEGPAPRTVAPDFRLKSVDGKIEVRLSSLRGKPVVLIFGSYT